MAAVANLRQIAQVLFVYANEQGGYPETLQDMPDDWLAGNPALEEVARKAHYTQPSVISTEDKFIMLVLPSKNGTAIAYSNTSSIFIRKK
jgi:hypothetical protein